MKVRRLRSPRPLRAVVSCAVVAASACLGLPAAARASYLAPVPVSGTLTQQFASATDPVLAADGTWVAFQGASDGITGVWERNITTGEVDLVAGGVRSDLNNSLYPLDASDADGPSVSANGQYVAFTTTAAYLVAGAEPPGDPGCPEVYVRNMALPASSPGAYTLVSALTGSTTGILFNSGSGCPGSGPTGFGVGGAQAASGVAMSADGSKVAFTVDSPSDLAGADTPASQVAVRDLDTNTTTLVSVDQQPGAQGEPTPDGGAYPSTESTQISPSSGAEGSGLALSAGEQLPVSTAAISADGTTVAWMGTNVPEQVPSATDVSARMSAIAPPAAAGDPAGLEVEPLWRRIADGPTAPTVRLLANAGLDFYDYLGYIESDDSISPPIFAGAEEDADPGVPALSGNGEEVAVTADAPPPSAIALLRQIYPHDPNLPSGLPDDLYLVDVSDATAPQVTPLTQISDYGAGTGAVLGSVYAVAISPDGAEVGLETGRNQFSLASPSLITPPTLYSGQAETYVVDVPEQTLELATSTYDGAAPDGASGLLSLDAAGDVAVDSVANNLFYGDVNAGSGSGTSTVGVSQVYVMDRVPPATAVASGFLSAPLATPTPTPAWSISATDSSRRNGTVLIRAAVPGAGELTVRASAQLPRAGRTVSRSRIPYRTVAEGRRGTTGASLVRLVVPIDRVDRRYAEARRGLYAHLIVRFTAAGHANLTRSIPVTFRVRITRHPRRRTRGRAR